MRALKTRFARSELSRRAFQHYDAHRWVLARFADPPPALFKAAVVKSHADPFDLLIETGTDYGDMIARVQDTFKRIISIDIDEGYFRSASSRFKQTEHVELLCGDSGKLLADLLGAVDTPALFWLDAHPGPGELGHVPLVEELQAVLELSAHGSTVLVDDARLIDGTYGWPMMADVEDLIQSSGRLVSACVVQDILRIQLA